MKQTKLFSSLLCLALLTVSGSAFAENEVAENQAGGKEPASLDVGMIFNVNGLTLDFDSYQGGLGAKIAKDNIAFRLMLDLFYSNSSNAFSLDLSTCFEYHFLDGPISPYLGAYLSAGYAVQEFTEGTVTSIRSIPLAVGPVFGMEVFIFDFLSLFAEYAVEFELNISTMEQSIAGSKSSETDSTFVIDTAMGNNSKLGIVLYFLRSDQTKALIKR